MKLLGCCTLFFTTMVAAHPLDSVLMIYGPEQGVKQSLSLHKNVQYKLQIASFNSKKLAIQYRHKIKQQLPDVDIHIVYFHDKSLYQVYLGPFKTLKDVHNVSNQLLNINPQSAVHANNKITVKPYVKYLDKDAALMPKHLPFDFSFAVGPMWTQANTAYMRVTPSDVNADVISHTSVNALYTFGIGYHVLSQATQRSYLNDLLLQLNYYYTTTNISGQAWDYLSSECNNQFYTAPLHSSRVVIDVKPQLFTYKSFSPYVLVGAGASWNNLKYTESPNGDYAVSSISLGTHTNQNIIYDLGAGINMQWRPEFSFALEYLYTSLGNLAPGSYSQSAQQIVAPPLFKVATQALLARVSWHFERPYYAVT